MNQDYNKLNDIETVPSVSSYSKNLNHLYKGKSLMDIKRKLKEVGHNPMLKISKDRENYLAKFINNVNSYLPHIYNHLDNNQKDNLMNKENKKKQKN